MRLLLLLLSLLAAGPTSAQRLIPYRRGLLWGYADSTRHVVIAPQYQYVEPFKGGLGKVWRAGKCGYVNPQGREVVPVRWDAASYQEKKIPWVYGGSLGAPFEPYAKNWVLVMQFDSVMARRYSFQPPAKPWLDWEDEQSRGYSASHSQLLGFYTPAGRQVLPARYASFYPLNAQCFVATQVVSRYDGREVGGCIIEEFVDRPIYGHQLITYTGRILAGGQTFSQINGLYGDTLLVGGVVDGDNRYHRENVRMLDTTGRVLLKHSADAQPQEFYALAPLKGTSFWVANYDKGSESLSSADSYLLQANGTPASSLSFRSIRPFTKKLAICYSATGLGGIWSLAEQQWLMTPCYEYMGNLIGPYLVVGQHQQYGIVDSTGCVQVPLLYDNLVPCQTRTGHRSPYWHATRAGHCLLLDTYGQQVARPSTSNSNNTGEFIDSIAVIAGPCAQDVQHSSPLPQASYQPHASQVPVQPVPSAAALWVPLRSSQRHPRSYGTVVSGTTTASRFTSWPTVTGDSLIVQTYLLKQPNLGEWASARYGLHTGSGRELLPPAYTYIDGSTNWPYITVVKAGLLGLLDSIGGWHLPLTYRLIWPTGRTGLVWVQHLSGRYALLRLSDNRELARLPLLPATQHLTFPAFDDTGISLLQVVSSEENLVRLLGYVDTQGRCYFEESSPRSKRKHLYPRKPMRGSHGVSKGGQAASALLIGGAPS
jgi:hypothetical protein